MPVIPKPVILAPLLAYNSINTPPYSLSQTHPHYKQLAQYLTIKMLIAALKIVQATQAT